MPAYPALVHLCRILGRGDALAALEVSYAAGPGGLPDILDEEHRGRLQKLVDTRLEQMAAALVEEAASSDDVTTSRGALDFISLQIGGFGDLLGPRQAQELMQKARSLTADWG